MKMAKKKSNAGRKPAPPGTKKASVMLEERYWDKAKKIGDGIMAVGFRRAIEEYKVKPR